VAHLFELAPSARAKCRGCDQPIERGALRFGERLPNPFGQGERTLWFHPLCAAYKRPEPFLEALADSAVAIPDRAGLERTAQSGMANRRVSRIDGAERARTGQAKCRHCREPISGGEWRIRLVFYEDGRFAPGGFVHIGCRKAYFDTDDVLDRVRHFSPDLSEEEREALRQVFAPSPTHPPAG
jgi:hypothetical protein